jgi:hypothetical protein
VEDRLGRVDALVHEREEAGAQLLGLGVEGEVHQRCSSSAVRPASSRG